MAETNLPLVTKLVGPEFPDPTEHAAAILEAVEGDLRLLRELLPSLLPTWVDHYGTAYCGRLIATLTTAQGEC
jgi:hypothetical protein